MTQIYIFIAGNPEARQHLVDSIENPVDDAIEGTGVMRLQRQA